MKAGSVWCDIQKLYPYLKPTAIKEFVQLFEHINKVDVMSQP